MANTIRVEGHNVDPDTVPLLTMDGYEIPEEGLPVTFTRANDDGTEREITVMLKESLVGLTVVEPSWRGTRPTAVSFASYMTQMGYEDEAEAFAKHGGFLRKQLQIKRNRTDEGRFDKSRDDLVVRDEDGNPVFVWINYANRCMERWHNTVEARNTQKGALKAKEDGTPMTQEQRIELLRVAMDCDDAGLHDIANDCRTLCQVNEDKVGPQRGAAILQIDTARNLLKAHADILARRARTGTSSTTETPTAPSAPVNQPVSSEMPEEPF